MGKAVDLTGLLLNVLTKAAADLKEAWGSLVEFSTGLTQ